MVGLNGRSSKPDPKVTVGVGRLRDHTWTLLGSTEAQRGADVDFLKRVTLATRTIVS